MLQFTPLWTRNGGGNGRSSSDGHGKRQTVAATATASAAQPGGTYRTLQRIVTAHPLSGCGNAGTGGGGSVHDDVLGGPSPLPVGEITTTVEEYYPSGTAPGGPSPRSVATAASSGQPLQDAAAGTHPPLYRRVAIRRGAGHVHGDGSGSGSGSGSSDGNNNDNIADVVNDLMAGNSNNPSTLDASYELPVLPLGTVRKRQPQQSQDGVNNDGNASCDGDGVYADPIVCWAAFGSRRRKQLCVLAGPSLLRIFDVYPSPGCGSGRGGNASRMTSDDDEHDHTTGNDVFDDDDDGSDDDVAGAGGGEGHSVTLPFECAGIYPMPDEVGGLLLQRAAEAEERLQQEEVRRLYFADNAAVGGGDGVGGEGRGLTLLDRQLSQEESSQESGSLAEALRRPPRAVRVEGGLTDVLMGDGDGDGDGDDTIDDSLSDVAARAGDAAAIAAAAAAVAGGSGLVIDGIGVGGTLTGTVGSAGFCGIGGGVPSIFSLLHPLDEVRPVALVPPFSNPFDSNIDNATTKSGDANDMMTDGDACAKLGSNHGDIVGAFSDVNERLMFVGRPRNLSSLPSSSSSRDRVDSTILVTYHTHRRRHAVWAVGAAPPPPDVLPLWKRTAASRRRAAQAGGPAARRIDAIAVDDGEGAGGGGIDGASQPPASTAEEGWVLLDDGTSLSRVGRQAMVSPRQPLPPAFGELHPTWTLSLLYEEEMEGRGGHDGEASDAFRFAWRRFFLSTTAEGSADSILCWVQRNRKGPKHGNRSILRRLNLARFQNQGRSSDHPLLLPDLPCEDAAPILSSPIPDPIYSPGSKARAGIHQTSPPRAIDSRLLC